MVQDRLAKRFSKTNHFDIFMRSHALAKQWGRKVMTVEVRLK